MVLRRLGADEEAVDDITAAIRLAPAQSGYYRHVRLADVKRRRDGTTDIILGWGEDGCRVAEVQRDNQFVGWYFVANEDTCYALLDWREPW
jgi:hypothetical protein